MPTKKKAPALVFDEPVDTTAPATLAPDDGEPVDFVADAQRVVADDRMLANVARLAQDLVTAQRKVTWYTDKLADANAELRKLRDADLPEAMTACNLAEFRTTDGHHIIIKDIVAASIPASRREEALAWLRDHGHAGLIKRAISVSLARGQDKLGDEVIKAMKALGVEVTATDGVHAQTLSAWAREMAEHNTPLPDDLLGIYRGRQAIIKDAPKTTKAKGA
jgi:hypothetical protein